jgi:hypothetical protein
MVKKEKAGCQVNWRATYGEIALDGTWSLRNAAAT